MMLTNLLLYHRRVFVQEDTQNMFSDKVSEEARSLRTFLMSKEIIYINTEYIQVFFLNFHLKLE